MFLKVERYKVRFTKKNAIVPLPLVEVSNPVPLIVSSRALVVACGNQLPVNGVVTVPIGLIVDLSLALKEADKI